MPVVFSQQFRPIVIGAILFFACLICYAVASLNFPRQFNLDNTYNYAATSYIAKHHKMPVVSAFDESIQFTSIGTTRSLRPPLTFIVSALAENVFDGVIENRISRQRLGSALIGALTVTAIFAGFWIAFNHLGLATFGAATVAVLPKFVFLASCNNDDIGAIFSVSALFAAVLALIRHGHKTWVLISLATSIGLVFQTKFTAWLVLPWFGLLCFFLLKPVWKSVLRRSILLALVLLASGGWWPVFNMVNYGFDDPTAFHHAIDIQRLLNQGDPNREGYAAEGTGVVDLLTNHDEFINKTLKSFVGYLEWLELEMSTSTYLFYGTIFLIGIIGVALRSRAALKEAEFVEPLILIMILSQCLFYLHHNLVRDIQPQARYLLPIIMPLTYLFLRALQQVASTSIVTRVRAKEYHFHTIAVTVLTILMFLTYYATLRDYIRPSYVAVPHLTRLGQASGVDIRNDLLIEDTSSISYSYVNESLEIRRTDLNRANLTLDSGVCELLPVNAVITMSVQSQTSGGLYLRIDRNNSKTYDNVYWRGLPVGRSLVVFIVDASECTGIQLGLTKNAHKVSLKDIQISELRIHRYGRPISH